MGRIADLDGLKRENLSPLPGFEPRTIESIGSHCINYSILAPHVCIHLGQNYEIYEVITLVTLWTTFNAQLISIMWGVENGCLLICDTV